MREIVFTKDGSHTIAIPEKGVTYHSVHGAVQESKHVFIESGLHCVFGRFKQPEIAVFEMGFGTGLNAFLTAIDATEKMQRVYYTAVEIATLMMRETSILNYADRLGYEELFQQLHQCIWNEDIKLNDFFTLRKAQTELADYFDSRLFDIIYYDAFAPSAQPELWTEKVLENCSQCCIHTACW